MDSEEDTHMMMDLDGEVVDLVAATTMTTIYKIDVCLDALDSLFADMDSVNVLMATQEGTVDALVIGAGRPIDALPSLIL